MEEVGKLLGVTRERIRQLIQKEIMRLNRVPTVSNELLLINSLLEKNLRMQIRDSIEQIYRRDDFSNGEIQVFLKVINYMLKAKGYYMFQE